MLIASVLAVRFASAALFEREPAVSPEPAAEPEVDETRDKALAAAIAVAALASRPTLIARREDQGQPSA